MNIKFEIDGKYTLVAISEGLAHSIRHEIVITGFNDGCDRFTFKENGRGKRREFFLPGAEKLDQQLVFEGHFLPFVLDSETDSFCGNAMFNFVTDDPAELRLFIKQYCLNPSPTTFGKCLYSPGNKSDIRNLPLFVDTTQVLPLSNG